MTPDINIQFVPCVLDFDDENFGRDPNGRMYRKDLAPGSAHWLSNVAGDPHACLDFVCPCGCGLVHAIPVSQGIKADHAWLWDGNIEKPTLTASILCTGPCGWHGYLTGGVFKTV